MGSTAARAAGTDLGERPPYNMTNCCRPRQATCELNKANPFDYLTELQKHSAELKQKPSEWMPWNYRETLARLATPAAA